MTAVTKAEAYDTKCTISINKNPTIAGNYQ